MILDVPGLRDNIREITDEQITKEIFFTMAANDLDKVVILLYHSLDNPSSEIKATLK